MVIGYVLLGFVAVMMFFGLLSGITKTMKLEPWVALVFVIAFIVGGIIPLISFGNVVYVGIGGFIVPSVLAVLLTIFVGFNVQLLRTVTAMVVNAAITVAVIVWMPVDTMWLSVLATFAIGLLTGAVAYAICGSRLSSAAGAIGGVVIGNVIGQMVNYFTGMSGSMVFGGSLIFDAVVISLVFSVMLASVTAEMRNSSGLRAQAGTESAKDNDIKDDEFDDYFEK